ncbi:HET-domain-containing protein [Ophiobolus disseminans]|uniref:HET-domain-containing protein n=1 Tax=Ophiobolus disseminans TaxID=1469910 RepID=A0A6A6ZFD8_9PLEO|nr:HET-domain-containing protein [Ophiobolus disseminans]
MSTTRLMPYTYTPLLTSDSIRLVELLPDDRDSPLRCNLMHVRGNRITTDYEALSYAWGESNLAQRLRDVATQTIFSITDNLHQALQALRRRKQSRWLWVDAVCIDPSNASEKHHQVKQMSNIYSEASQVIVWTGRDDCLEAMTILASVGRALSVPDLPVHEGEMARHMSTAAHAMSVPDMDVLEDYFGRPWFHRVWAFQEFVVAKQARLHAGRMYMSYRLFRKAVYACRDFVLSSVDDLWRRFPNLRRVADLVLFKDLYRRHEFPRNTPQNKEQKTDEDSVIFRLLKILANRQCSDERDRFYAMIGFLPDNLQIAPSYAISIFELRMAITKKCFFAGEMSLLDCAENLGSGDEQHSLVSSFLIRIPHSADESESHRPIPFHPTSHFSPLHRIAGTRPPKIQDISPSTISLRGVSIDRISTTIFFPQTDQHPTLSTNASLLNNATFNPGPALASNLSAVFEFFKTFRTTHCHRPAPKPASLTREFWHTINCDPHLTDPPGPIQDFDSLLQKHEITHPYFQQRIFFTTELGFFGMCSKHTRSGDQVVFFDGVKKPGIDIRFLDLPYRENIVWCFEHRVFFVTTTGFVGLGPWWLKEQDQVVVFDGAETLFILRQSALELRTETWKFVGDCYDGWMDGEYFGHKIVDHKVDEVIHDDPINDEHQASRATFRTSNKRIALQAEDFVLC